MKRQTCLGGCRKMFRARLAYAYCRACHKRIRGISRTPAAAVRKF